MSVRRCGVVRVGVQSTRSKHKPMVGRIVCRCRRRRHRWRDRYRNSYKPMVFTAVQGRRDRVSYTKDGRVPSRFPRTVWRAVLPLHHEHTHILCTVYNIRGDTLRIINRGTRQHLFSKYYFVFLKKIMFHTLKYTTFYICFKKTYFFTKLYLVIVPSDIFFKTFMITFILLISV